MPAKSDGAGQTAPPRAEDLKAALRKRLARIEGQVRGVGRMVEEGACCDEVLAQVAAIKSALDGASTLILEHHLRGCVASRFRAGDDGIVEELKTTIGRMLK
jgi:DNA-binding FrmR family transcriptional regulator